MTGGGTSCSYSSARASGGPCKSRRPVGSRRTVMRVVAVNYDPENLFPATPDTGIIERRMRQKMMEKDKDFAKSMARANDDIRRQVLVRRELRTPPAEHVELIEFMLNTEAEDMEFEVARCRPKFTPAFFKALDSIIGSERFNAKPDQEMAAANEIDIALVQLLQQNIEAAKAAEQTAAADFMEKVKVAVSKYLVKA
ncbi:hypothetical protein TSOC_001880 [Tetrabaena socialis]|uniref:Uncharacterized protein n=1 Tax=Tetrabaena socialis TaxID=47790 RepID=A0A2J8AFF9_9CHLO|nr:hypothetical protein TSOC_001880 [Tetrabaena socialis]|eukprot:PNH11257.1 hypothetical protein TSOC_001880 [Tetrabaena socialis]